MQDQYSSSKSCTCSSNSRNSAGKIQLSVFCRQVASPQCSGIPTMQLSKTSGAFDNTKSSDEFEWLDGRVPQFFDTRLKPRSLKTEFSARPSVFVLSFVFHSSFRALKSPVTTSGLLSTTSDKTENACLKEEV
eukprot:scpid95486/ scgid21481/ 